ncbi:MAG: hypothetical protein AWT59_2380 [Candidatus Gallionella acididurans]|uniref:Uncharacterized protein n=1 Tax=Candidatus Gallionella acididurans TaxID=1796491 RepID=A0A139BRT2_9PROT|nr:MAG: hypothetical protein AWT59_2380 [Candidatus Gallionella acididurans]
MDKEIQTKIVLGEAGADLAEAWFKLLGFVAVTGVFHAAAEKTDLLGLAAVKWICYGLMFIWLQYKVDKATWLLFPTADPTNEKAKLRHLSIALTVSFVITSTTYTILYATIYALLKIKGAG